MQRVNQQPTATSNIAGSRRIPMALAWVAMALAIVATMSGCGVEAAGGGNKKMSPMLIEEDGVRRLNRQAGE